MAHARATPRTVPPSLFILASGYFFDYCFGPTASLTAMLVTSLATDRTTAALTAVGAMVVAATSGYDPVGMQITTTALVAARGLYNTVCTRAGRDNITAAAEQFSALLQEGPGT